MIERLNSKLTYTILDDNGISIDHEEYGHICILDQDENLKLAEEIVRDALFDKSEEYVK